MNIYGKKRAGAVMALLLVAGCAGIAGAATPAATPPGSTLEQRIAQRKAEQATNLNKTDLQRVLGQCVKAQTTLRTGQAKEVSMLDNHVYVYGVIDAKLWVTIGQLKLANTDSFQLEKQRQGLVDKTANFQGLAAHYKQALDDTLLINCKADPNGFRAMLDTARFYDSQLRAQSADSRTYIINSVKNSLSSYIPDLQVKATTAGRKN